MKTSLFLLLLVVALCSGGVNGLVVSLPDQFAKLAKVFKPQIRRLAQQHLPKTYGNCHDKNPPRKCEHHGGNLYQEQTTFYKVKARWITGINDLHMRDLSVVRLEDGRLAIAMMVQMTNLPMSLRLEACSPLLGCGLMLWDNESGCCGRNKRIWATITISCSSQAPYLRHAKLESLKMDKIQVHNSIFGKYKVKLADVTKSAEDGVKTALGNFLRSDAINELNGVIQSLYGRFELTCESLQK